MADDTKDIEGDEQGGGGKKKLIIIIALVALLLIGGGLAAFFLLSGDDEESAEGTSEPTEEIVEPIEEGEPIYVEMKPQFVVNLPPGGPAKMLQIAITVFTRQQEVADFISENDPMLRHHLIDLLEEQDATLLMTLEGKQALQAEIQELIAAKLEEFKQAGEIKGVFFTQFVMQ